MLHTGNILSNRFTSAIYCSWHLLYCNNPWLCSGGTGTLLARLLSSSLCLCHFVYFVLPMTMGGCIALQLPIVFCFVPRLLTNSLRLISDPIWILGLVFWSCSIAYCSHLSQIGSSSSTRSRFVICWLLLSFFYFVFHLIIDHQFFDLFCFSYV